MPRYGPRQTGVAAIMMVRDEADIIRYTLQHLLGNVAHIFVLDNGSADGTSDTLASFATDTRTVRGPRVTVLPDDEVGYYQSAKMTGLAARARDEGFQWVIPCDADEFWIAPGGKTLEQHLLSFGPDVQIVKGAILNHVPTASDGDDPNPAARIRWRLREPGGLPKVAARTAEDLVIGMGNHDASYASDPHAFAVGGLTIHHYSWRTPEQYVRKIRNGAEAYAATDLDPGFGAHWRSLASASDDELRAHFDKWFHFTDPAVEGLVYDPALLP